MKTKRDFESFDRVNKTQEVSKVVRVSTAELKPHPINEKIYGKSCDEELLRSVKDVGILAPLLITREKTIISGHQRFYAALHHGILEVPVLYFENETIDVREVLILANRQRHKTNEQIGREFAELEIIEKARAKKRQSNKADQDGEPVPQAEKGKARDLAGKKLGVSGVTAARAAVVVKKIDELNAKGEVDQAKELASVLNKNAKRAQAMVLGKDPAPKLAATGSSKDGDSDAVKAYESLSAYLESYQTLADDEKLLWKTRIQSLLNQIGQQIVLA